MNKLTSTAAARLLGTSMHLVHQVLRQRLVPRPPKHRGSICWDFAAVVTLAHVLNLTPPSRDEFEEACRG